MGLQQIKVDGVDFHFRPGTSDEAILENAFSKNPEYIFAPIKNVKHVFDIGANIGVITRILHARYPDATIWAFEPEKENFEILKKNTEFSSRIKILNFGLFSNNGVENLLKSDDPKNMGGFSLYKPGTNGVHQLIDLHSVTEFLNEVNIQSVDVIKIDTEGSEFEILKNMNLKDTKIIEGELHGQKDWELLAHLADNFELAVKKEIGDRVFNFKALNKNRTVLQF